MSSPFDEALSSSFSTNPSTKPLLDDEEKGAAKKSTKKKSLLKGRKAKSERVGQSTQKSKSFLPRFASSRKAGAAAGAAAATATGVGVAAGQTTYKPPSPQPPNKTNPFDDDDEEEDIENPPPKPPSPTPPITAVTTTAAATAAAATATTTIPQQSDQQLLDELEHDSEEMQIHEELQAQEENLNEALLRERHEDVQNIHSSMAMINEIQRDLAGMVESQQEDIDIVEENAEETAERADRGLSHIERASQRDSQTRTCLFAFFIILAIVVIVIIIWLCVRKK